MIFDAPAVVYQDALVTIRVVAVTDAGTAGTTSLRHWAVVELNVVHRPLPPAEPPPELTRRPPRAKRGQRLPYLLPGSTRPPAAIRPAQRPWAQALRAWRGAA